MIDDPGDEIEFDDMVALALAKAVDRGAVPGPHVKARLMASLAAPPVPDGFRFVFGADAEWLPHPVPGIRMQVLSLDHASGYAVLLLDAAPGTRFPAHHHGGAEECYVLSGTVQTCNRKMRAGDFLHAAAGTEHGELWTDEGARVLLVVSADDYLPPPSGQSVPS
jgi:quercetin dioxygenase-like cupin family protein